jgi:hypothetical protein
MARNQSNGMGGSSWRGEGRCLVSGYGPHRVVAGLYGFSVQYQPGRTVKDLAQAGQFPNAQISYQDEAILDPHSACPVADFGYSAFGIRAAFTLPHAGKREFMESSTGWRSLKETSFVVSGVSPLHAIRHRWLPSAQNRLVSRNAHISRVSSKMRKMHQSSVRNVGCGRLCCRGAAGAGDR